MCKGDTAVECTDVETVQRCLSLPSLAAPHATRNVPPVPLPRRKSSTAQDRKCVNNLQQNRVSCTTASGVSGSLELGAGVKANSCQDIQSSYTTAECCAHEDNDKQIIEHGSSVTNGNCSTNGTPASDIAASINGTVRDLDSVLPVIPQRSKYKELPPVIVSSDADKISTLPVISVSHVESADDGESYEVKQSKGPFPQPKPRVSLLSASTTPPSDKTEQAPRRLSQNDLAVEDDSVTQVDSTCPDVDNPIESETSEKVGQSSDCQKLREQDRSSVDPEQHQLEVQSNVSAVKLESPVLVPSRAAPPPPLPKPKVVLHKSGSFEVVQPLSNDVFENCSDSTSDSVSVSVQSSLVSKNGDDAVSKRSRRQLVENSEMSSSNAARPGSLESSGSGVFYHNGDSDDAVVSTSVPVALSSVAKTGQTSKDKGCEMNCPVPAVRMKKKSQISCGSSVAISRSADFHDFQKDSKNGHSHDPATRSWSEDVVQVEVSSELHLMASDAVDQSSLKPCQTRVVPSRPVRLFETGGAQTGADFRRNSSPSCTLTETGHVFPSLPKDYVASTPPITPSAFGFDAVDEEARMVC